MPKERDFENTVLSLRLTGAEAVRFWQIMDAAKSRNAYVGKSDIFRELIGLNPANALSDDEIRFFRTGQKNSGGMKLAHNSAHSLKTPKEESHNRRRKQGG